MIDRGELLARAEVLVIIGFVAAIIVILLIMVGEWYLSDELKPPQRPLAR